MRTFVMLLLGLIPADGFAASSGRRLPRLLQHAPAAARVSPHRWVVYMSIEFGVLISLIYVVSCVCVGCCPSPHRLLCVDFACPPPPPIALHCHNLSHPGQRLHRPRRRTETRRRTPTRDARARAARKWQKSKRLSLFNFLMCLNYIRDHKTARKRIHGALCL